MAERIATTSKSNISNNAMVVAIDLLSKIVVGARIRGSDIEALNTLMRTLCGHTHTWEDKYGEHTYGNLNPDGYSADSFIVRTTDPAIPGVGFAPYTPTGNRIYAGHVNFGIDLHNQLLAHTHQTVNQET